MEILPHSTANSTVCKLLSSRHSHHELPLVCTNRVSKTQHTTSIRHWLFKAKALIISKILMSQKNSQIRLLIWDYNHFIFHNICLPHYAINMSFLYLMSFSAMNKTLRCLVYCSKQLLWNIKFWLWYQMTSMIWQKFWLIKIFDIINGLALKCQCLIQNYWCCMLCFGTSSA